MKVQATPLKDSDVVNYWLWCPGCEDIHMINNTWSFDGNLEKPTFEPSILVESVGTLDAKVKVQCICGKHDFHTPRCHSFVRNGEWQFLSDSEHKLAGKIVPMVDLPEWMQR